MKAEAARCLSALIQYLQRRLGGEMGSVISIKTRRVCKDRRCGRVVNAVLSELTRGGLVDQHKQGIYLIKKEVAEEVLKILKSRCSGCPQAPPALQREGGGRISRREIYKLGISKHL